MSIERAKQHLKKWNRDTDVIVLENSSATVELAAQALGVTGPEIAKSMSFYDRAGGVILIVASGNRKIDNRKFKDEFGFKAKMLSLGDVELLTGHPAGGVCPFGVLPDVKVFLDLSLRSFEYIYPACGSGNSAIRLTPAELEEYSQTEKWIDVTKD